MTSVVIFGGEHLRDYGKVIQVEHWFLSVLNYDLEKLTRLKIHDIFYKQPHEFEFHAILRFLIFSMYLFELFRNFISFLLF